MAATVEVPWSLAALRREWNRTKDEVAPWWRSNSKEAANTGLFCLSVALKAWVDSKKGRRKGARVGFPVFKKRHARRSCRFTTGAFGCVDARHVRLPRIGVVRSKEPTATLQDLIAAGSARIQSATRLPSGDSSRDDSSRGRSITAFNGLSLSGRTRAAAGARIAVISSLAATGRPSYRAT